MAPGDFLAIERSPGDYTERYGCLIFLNFLISSSLARHPHDVGRVTPQAALSAAPKWTVCMTAPLTHARCSQYLVF